MAITRTAPYGVLTDDSGAGTDGTTFNNTWLQGHLDLLDARWSRVTITSTGSQNNLDISQADFVIFNNASDLTITGIAAPSSPAKPGKPVRYVCIGAGNVYFKHQSASSTAANRLINFATSGDTPHAGGSGSGTIVYDDVTARWRLVAHEQGQPLTPTYNASNYAGNGSMTWTVDSGDVAYQWYYLKGRVLTVAFEIDSTTVAGTPNVQLLLVNSGWGGFTASATQLARVPIRITDNGTAQTGFGDVAASGTQIRCFQTIASSGVSWAASTNNTGVQGEITFPVQ